MQEKFIEELFFDDYEVLTPDGFKDFRGIGKTVEYQEYVIHFVENEEDTFICADDHIVILYDNTECFTKDLKHGDKILSSNSDYLTVDYVECTDNYSHMYDLLDVDGGVYNTSNIVSHNSTITVGYALHKVLFQSYYSVFLLAQNHKASKGLLNRVKIAYENLPSFIQAGIVKLNDTELWLENGSSIKASATTKTGIRSNTVNCVICDELAFVPSNIAKEFWAAVRPVVSSGKTTKFFAISTPNGYGLFYDIYMGATKKLNGFQPVYVDWTRIPGRDEEWKREEIAVIGQEAFDREYGCSFESSSKCLINAIKIGELMNGYEKPMLEDEEGDLLIYERPIENEQYLIIVDTAKGVESDYSAFTIIKITTNIHEVVGVYRNNKISPLVYPEILYKVGLNYNDAGLLIENNEYGSQVLGILLYEYEYPNIIWTEVTNKKQRISYGNDGSSSPGVRTTSSIKNIGCSNLKAIIEHDKLIIKDHDTINELSKFVKVKDSYQAEEGHNDDIVITLVLYAWLTTQNYFKDIEQNVGKEIRDIYEDNINDNMITFGFHNNGVKENRRDAFTEYEEVENENSNKEWDEEELAEIRSMFKKYIKL